MTSKVKIVSIDELESMHTGTLLKRRKDLLACEESFEESDRVGYETKPDPDVTGYIEYKDTTYWQQAYQALKDILSCRENQLNREERKQVRVGKASNAKSSGRGRGK